LEQVLLPTPQKFVMYECGNDEGNKESIRASSISDFIGPNRRTIELDRSGGNFESEER